LVVKQALIPCHCENTERKTTNHSIHTIKITMTSFAFNPSLIFGPVFALMGLLVVVTVLVFRERVQQFKSLRVHPQKVSTRAEFSSALKDTRCADNYANLFESPVMFYVACVGLYVTHTVSMPALVLAWVYVLLRMAHSHVHCGSNHVMTRFKLFAASMFVLLALWVVWAWALLA
jgi:hypothetical protein